MNAFYARVAHAETLYVIGAVEGVGVQLLDERVGEMQALAEGEAAEGVGGQVLGLYAVQVDLVDEGGRDERVALDELDGRLLVVEREEEVGHVAQAVERVAAYASDRVADEVDDLDGAAHAEYVAVDEAELVGAQGQVVEVTQAAERVRLELVQARVVGHDQHFQVGQVAEGEHANFGQIATVSDHDRLQAAQALYSRKQNIN